MEKYLKFLAKTQLFSNIKETEIKVALNCISYKVEKYSNNQSIFNEGDIISKIGMVISGSLQIIQDDFFGNRSIIMQVSPGNLFGEVFAFSENSPLNVSVIAAEESEIIYFDFKKMITVCQSACGFYNRLIRNLLNIVAQKNIFITRKLQYLSKRTIRDKVITYLSDEYKKQGKQAFTIPFNRQQLADYLLVDRSTLSNELSKMFKEGILDYHKNNFRFKNSFDN